MKSSYIGVKRTSRVAVQNAAVQRAEPPTRALANVKTITEWIETAQELGRAIPQPKGRLMFA
jgi:hypothetical protein